MKPHFIAVLTVLALGRILLPVQAQQRGPIIDMHQHTQPDEGVQSVVAVMDEFHVVKAFLSGWLLEDVYSWTAAAPGRFIPSPLFPGREGGFPDIDSLRAEYLAGRLQGMGEITAQYAGIAADDPRLEPFFALAEEFDVPVLIHHHGTAGPSEQFRISLGHPEQLEEVLVHHPTLRIYIEQSGFPFLDETIALMYRYPNVYGDLSWHQNPREIWEWYLHRLMDAGLGERLMFGTDGPSSRIPQAVEAIESASFLTDEQKRDIFYNNAARFLRLSDEEIARHHGR